MPKRIGSLFSGYGGLETGVAAALANAGYGTATVAWHVEFDEAPTKILDHHWPGVPNYGDITAVDWTAVEPVHVLTGGFPCQDLSLAGARKGLKEGTRSGLWSYFAEAINELRPELVVIENVRGLLSAEAHSGVEPCVDCLGDRADAVSLRALGAVLGDLADLGYDAQWCGLRAADAGAPHGRFRVFILAYPSVRHPRHNAGSTQQRIEPQNASSRIGEPSTIPTPHPGSETPENADRATGSERRVATPHETETGRPRTDTGRRSRTPTPDTGSDGLRRYPELDREPQKPELETPQRAHVDRRATADTEGKRQLHGNTVDLGPTGGKIDFLSNASDVARGAFGTPPTTPDADGVGRERGRGRLTAGSLTAALDPATDSRGQRLAQHPGEPPTEETRTGSSDLPDGSRGSRIATDWGPYRPAIERWERVVGRTAPPPTNSDGKNGSHRLSAQFVEWLMGLDAGHVTDPAIGLTRNQQLKGLGNGVVPAQAELAVRYLLGRMEKYAPAPLMWKES